MQGNEVDLARMELHRRRYEARHFLREAQFNLLAAKMLLHDLTKRHGSQELLISEIDTQHGIFIKQRERQNAKK